MKLRIFPIVATVAVTAVLLFGGWFTYRQMALQGPLEKLVKNYKGVKEAQLDITQSTVGLKLDLKPGTDLKGLVDYINKDGKSLLGNRSLKLDVEDHSSPALDKWWGNAMFPIAEAMENRNYTQIPETLSKLVKTNSSIQATAEMDDQNVYIALTDGQASKFIILPRIPEKIGVWNNA
ncbi:hypothetical protein DCC85_12585 [Paenibacillus sp. CAA11]|uniref:hypothetical protein n=1 Tax=Paenibacillus sp. CAA11 TaxID=1532905 RepID=UPI000D34985E|nr:hypothetical protein [Paenibacillus sp. CAA11]AWB44973.1 hypothetical protein DCC85_12585 [Paenibacillus sp. CAA11]